MIGGIRYAVDEIRKHYDDYYWWHGRLQTRVVGPLQESLEDDHGVDVMAEDWDNLLVLDACRTDIFEDTIGTDRFDDYRVMRSRGSATPEWMEENFAGGEFGDTVYVSGNPWVSKKAPDAFHEIRNIWLDEFDVVEEELRDAEILEDVGIPAGATIPAERVNEAAVEAHNDHPDKRLIVHYFQPHAPYIGNSDGTRKESEEVDEGVHPGRPLRDGEVSEERVWEQYRDNLEYVFHHASELADQLGGKTVITSDHGEMFGERLSPVPMKCYAHPMHIRSPELVEVPWAVIDGERREITDGGVNTTDVEEDLVDERLRDLGYKQ